MKTFILLISLLFLGSPDFDIEPTLICVRKNNAQNICYYNFEIDGDRYYFMDIGCKYSREKLMKKIAKGSVGLAKDWKIPC